MTACKSNCKNIATALEMYASDNGGHYPESLDRLIPGNYLKVIPTCPSAQKVSYTNYEVHASPDNYSFACVGNNHAKAYTGYPADSSNYPRYEGLGGLVDHP